MARNLTNGTSPLSKSADEVKRHRTYRKLIPIAMGCIAIIILIVYIISMLYMKFGSFTVSINKYHQLKYGLSLSESREFVKPTSRLECSAVEGITNIDGKTLDNLDIGAVDGEDSGDNYLCYSFYLKNAGKEIVSFDYAVDIVNMTMGVEKAVRVRIIRNINGEDVYSTDYARAKGVDQNGNSIAEENTTPFYNKNMVTQGSFENFKPGDVAKYTVVIWLEGNDPDCVDAIIGGTFKIDMKFSVVGNSDLKNKKDKI